MRDLLRRLNWGRGGSQSIVSSTVCYLKALMMNLMPSHLSHWAHLCFAQFQLPAMRTMQTCACASLILHHTDDEGCSELAAADRGAYRDSRGTRKIISYSLSLCIFTEHKGESKGQSCKSTDIFSAAGLLPVGQQPGEFSPQFPPCRGRMGPTLRMWGSGSRCSLAFSGNRLCSQQVPSIPQKGCHGHNVSNYCSLYRGTIIMGILSQNDTFSKEFRTLSEEFS